MKVFRFDDHSDGDEVPPEVEKAMNQLADALTEFLVPGEGDSKSPPSSHKVRTKEAIAERQADHAKFDELQAHLEKAKGTSVSTTDGYKLRVVAYTALMDDIGTSQCIHDNKMADDLLAMADRLDELDLKESVIGA